MPEMYICDGTTARGERAACAWNSEHEMQWEACSPGEGQQRHEEAHENTDDNSARAGLGER